MSRNQEWFTHEKPLAIVQRVFLSHHKSIDQPITLDPFANTERTVPAKYHFVGAEWRDGFELPWGTTDKRVAQEQDLPLRTADNWVTVFINGPWNQMDAVVNKILSEWSAGNIDEAIMLAPSRTDRPWSQLLMRKGFLRYEPDERYHYMRRKLDEGGNPVIDSLGRPVLVKESQISHPSHLYYIGENPGRFIRHCTEGVIVRSAY